MGFERVGRENEQRREAGPRASQRPPATAGGIRAVLGGEIEVHEVAEGPAALARGFRPDGDFVRSLDVQRGRGAALPDPTRERMEGAFGADFSAVRVHTDSQAARLAAQVQARAFTRGPDIFFGRGAYDPGSRAGQRLLAHELTHCVQQRAAPGPTVQAELEIGAAGDAFEREADRVADRVVAGGDAGPVSAHPGGDGALQREFQAGVIVGADGASVHKSNQKKVARGDVGRYTVRSGGIFGTGLKAKLPKGTLLEVDPAVRSLDGHYLLVRYADEHDQQKTGFVRDTKVMTYAQLGQVLRWDETGLGRGFLDEHATDLPRSQRRFRNHQQRSINNETNAFLTAIGGQQSQLFNGVPVGEVHGAPAIDDFTVGPVTGATAPEALTKQQRRFLAGFDLKAAEAYRRGFIVRYQSYPRRFRNLMCHGPVLWTLDTDGILSIGSTYNNKHAVVAGGKDVFAAGEAHLKTAREYYRERGDLTPQQLELWGEIVLKKAEIESYRKLNLNDDVERVTQEIAPLMQKIGGQQVYDRITQIDSELAPGERPTVVIDFGSGHYSPKTAWRRATEAWRQVGFTVEWDRRSNWV